MSKKILLIVLNLPRALMVLPVFVLLPSNKKNIIKADIDRYSYLTGTIKQYWIKLIFLLINNRAFRNIYQRRLSGGGDIGLNFGLNQWRV